MMLATLETLLEQNRVKTFSGRVRLPAVHLIKTYDRQERPCWFLLKANELSLMRLERTTYEDMIDLTHYGEIVASGWGHEPDEQALKKFSASEA